MTGERGFGPGWWIVVGAVVIVGLSVWLSEPDGQSSHASARPLDLCRTLIAQHQQILESTFERQIRSVSGYDERSTALHALNVYERGIDGELKDPGIVVADAVAAIARVQDSAKRQQLEYVLLGPAMSLEARRAFEAYCVK